MSHELEGHERRHAGVGRRGASRRRGHVIEGTFVTFLDGHDDAQRGRWKAQRTARARRPR